MLRLTAERRSLAKVSGASAPESRFTKTSSALHGSAQEPQRSSVARKPRFTISDAAAWAIATLVVGIILIAACVLLTLGAPR